MAERELRWQAAARRSLDYVVQPLTDASRIRELLRPRVEYTAYALGQLEPGLFERTRWLRAVGDTGSGLVLHSRGGLGEATFVLGDPGAIEAILSVHPGPGSTYATCQPQHLPALRSVYRVPAHATMLRMAVTRETFRPVYTEPIVSLGGVDTRRINALYSSDGSATFYIGEHIEAGVYRGITVDGRLVSIAGTHAVSRREGVAVVGNVFTHPAHRGKGYGTATTSAVTEVLLNQCNHVVLTVDPANRPAVRSYQNLGYYEVCEMIEATAVRRDPFGVTPALRRWRARARGRRYGGLFVSVSPHRERDRR